MRAHTYQTITVLGTDSNLYFIAGHRHFKLQMLEQPLDTGWTPRIRQQLKETARRKREREENDRLENQY